MSKKFTKKELVNRTRAKKRRHALKVAPVVKGKKITLEEQNKAVLDKLAAEIAK